MRVFNGKLAALTLALMMVFGTGRSLMAEGAPADSASAGTPITFEDAVQIALKQNITLAQAQNAVASDAASVRGAKLSFLPNLQLSTSGSQVYGRNFDQTTGDVLNRNNQSLNAGISSSITLFNGLQNVATLHEAQKNQDAGELDLTRAKQTTVFTVASNYLAIITAQEQLKVQQQNLASLEAQEDEIKKMVSAGARAISDLYSQQASTAAARLAVVNAQHDLELGKVDLVQTLRLDPKVTYNFIAPAVNDTVATQYNLDSLTARAYAQRADLAAESARVDASAQGVKVANAGWWPTVSLSAGYNTAYTSATGSLDPRPVQSAARWKHLDRGVDSDLRPRADERERAEGKDPGGQCEAGARRAEAGGGAGGEARVSQLPVRGRTARGGAGAADRERPGRDDVGATLQSRRGHARRAHAGAGGAGAGRKRGGERALRARVPAGAHVVLHGGARPRARDAQRIARNEVRWTARGEAPRAGSPSAGR